MVSISIRSASESRGEYSRIGAATDFDVARQPLDDLLGNAIHRFYFFGKHLPHADKVVAGETLKGFDGQLAQAFALLLRELGHDAADLVRQLDADFVVLVVGQDPVGMRRRGRIGGYRTARRFMTFGGEEKQDFRRRIGPARQRLACSAVMRFEDLENIPAVELLRKRARPVSLLLSYRHAAAPASPRGKAGCRAPIVGNVLLRSVKRAWLA